MIINDVNIPIPIGINNNTIIKVDNEGNDGLYGGKNGDLLVTTIIKDNDNIYKRYGIRDIISNEEIPYYDAILGITKEVNTIHGKLLIDIPKGTQHNDMIKIKNYGIRVSQSQQGDAFINIKIKIPNDVSNEEYRLLSLIQSQISNK
jgi:DnaJ-class molecular chaperone